MVEERRAALEAVRHGRDVDLDQQIVGQIGVDVGIGGALGRAALAIQPRCENRTRSAIELVAHAVTVQRILLGVAEIGHPVRVALGVGRRRVDQEPADITGAAARAGLEGKRAADRRHRPARRRGQRVEPAGGATPGVARIAEEALVAAVAVERDGDVTPGDLGDVPGRHGRRIGERLAVVPGELGDDCDGVGLDDELMVIGAVTLGDHAGIAPLVIRRVLEADGEGLDRAVRGARHRRDDRCRIDAARQKGAEWHVRDQPHTHRLVEALRDCFLQLFDRPRPRRFRFGERPIALAARCAVAFDDHVMGGVEPRDAGEGGHRRGHILQRQVMVDRGQVGHARHAGPSQDRLDLGTEQELAVVPGVIEWLLAQPVAGEQQSTVARIPQDEGEHTA